MTYLINIRPKLTMEPDYANNKSIFKSSGAITSQENIAKGIKKDSFTEFLYIF